MLEQNRLSIANALNKNRVGGHLISFLDKEGSKFSAYVQIWGTHRWQMKIYRFDWSRIQHQFPCGSPNRMATACS